jgi:diguanylate cyclase (GGDEF)-like protein
MMMSRTALADAAAPGSVPAHALDVRIAQVRLGYENALLSQLVALFAATLLAIVEWSAVDHATVLAWLTVMVAVTGARLQLSRAFARAEPDAGSIDRWRSAFIFSAGCSGVMWGGAAVILFPANAFVCQVFTAFVIAGMIAGSVATLSPVLLAFVAFAIPALLPISIQFLLHTDPVHFAMSVMAVLYGFAMFTIAKHLEEVLCTSITMSLRNAQLVDVLKRANVQAELLNENLQDEVAERRQREHALREGEAFLADAQRMAHLGSWTYEIETSRATWSDETYRIVGRDRSLGVPTLRSLSALIRREDRRRVHGLLRRAVRHGEPFETQFRITGPKQSIVWLHMMAQPRIDEAGGAYELRGTVLDVTAHKMQERQLDAERRVFEAIATGVPVKAVLESLCHLLEAQIPAVGAIYLRAGDEALIETAAPSLPAQYRLDHVRTVLGSHPGLCAGTSEQEHAVLATSIATDPRWEQHRQDALAAGLRACWAVPVLGTSKPVLGVIAAYFMEPREPSTHDLQLIDRIGNIAKIALERDEAERRIRQLAHYDELTGLPNRALFNQSLEQSLAHARREKRAAALLFVDLDRFKNINDTLGHDAGDRILRQVAERLRGCVRGSDVVARFGGDEFMVLLTELEEVRHAAIVAGKLLEAICQPLVLGSQEFHLSASIGISAFPDDGDDPRVLQKNADIAMYRAKERGRNCWHFYSPATDAQSMERLRLEADLRRALERGELELHFQPKLSIVTGRITGTEALLRWRHPELGMIPPNKFIPLAEETGLIVPIGEWVLRRAVEQTTAMQRLVSYPLSIAVNLSARQFENESLLQAVTGVLQEHAFDPALLELEITESLLMQNTELSERMLRRLKELRVRLSMDDFGTGYSSLAYLKRFPVDTLKIDRSFVHGVPGDADACSLTQAIIALAHSLRLRTVAEGVETVEQVEFLRAHHCDEIQGFWFSRPLPYAEIVEKLKSHTAHPASAERATAVAVWP